MTLPAPDSPGMKGAEYASNKGCGPLVARIVGTNGGCITMERWNPKAKTPQRRQFTIDIWVLSSPTCGWKKIGGGT